VRLVDGVADLVAAREATGRNLEAVGGAPSSSMRALRVSSIIGANGLAEEVTIQAHDHRLTCEFWDYGVEERISAPLGP
jgi:hypothetical protein